MQGPSCRKRFNGVPFYVSKSAFQKESLIIISTVGNALGRAPEDSVVRLLMPMCGY